jgi:hypothetical protein
LRISCFPSFYLSPLHSLPSLLSSLPRPSHSLPPLSLVPPLLTSSFAGIPSWEVYSEITSKFGTTTASIKLTERGGEEEFGTEDKGEGHVREKKKYQSNILDLDPRKQKYFE